MDKLLTAKQVEDRYGFNRSSLLRWEDEGKLGNVLRTPGGQRRYEATQIEKSLNTSPGRYVTTDKQVQPDTTRQRPRGAMFKELGGSGLRHYGGGVTQEQLHELQGHAGYERYSEMRKNHPVIAAVFFGLINALKQPSVRVKPASDSEADKECAEFIESCLGDMSWSWLDTIDLVLNPLFEQGFAVPELVYKKRMGHQMDGSGLASSLYNDGRIGWRKWAPRPAESLAEGNEWVLDAHGGVRGINQMLEYDTVATTPLVPIPGFNPNEQIDPVVTIPIEKLLHFRTTLHPANNPEGMSLLRPMYLPYYYSIQLQDIEAIGAERDLAGVPVIYLGEGTTLGDDPNSDWSIAKDIVVNLRNDEQTGVVIPHPKLGSDGKGALLELLSTGGARSWDVSKIIERYDKRIALTTLAQFIMLGMEQVGSYALAQSQGDLFVVAAQAFLSSVAGVINRHAVPRLVMLNVFPNITGFPEVAFSPVGVPKLDELSEFVNKLVEREVLTPDAELERHLRQVGNLPPRMEADINTEQQFGEEVGRDAEKTALLLRRISLAVQPLQDLGAIAPGEGAALLKPLVDELRTSLGADPNLPGVTPESLAVSEQETGMVEPEDEDEEDEDEFEETVARAKLRLRYDRAAGVPLAKAAKNYVDTILGRKVEKGHGQTVEVTHFCPECGFDKADQYLDHGGLVVCKGCGRTYDPAY